MSDAIIRKLAGALAASRETDAPKGTSTVDTAALKTLEATVAVRLPCRQRAKDQHRDRYPSHQQRRARSRSGGKTDPRCLVLGLAGVFSISGSHLVRLVPQFESGQNCSGHGLHRLGAAFKRGSSAVLMKPEPDVDQFVRSQNVARYRRLLQRVTDESDPTTDNRSACRRAPEAKRRWRSGLIALDGGELRPILIIDLAKISAFPICH